jgi:EAL domain-containing protein (putative c-di-GMP-specific phosphodiesterase class I)/GGDEF domain-containing protein
LDRSQRNRFLAFSFASADLLLEVDTAGRVVFALGASTRLFGIELKGLAKRHAIELFHEAERGLLSQVMSRVHVAQRFGPLVLRSATPAQAGRLVVNGCRMPEQPDTLFITVSEARTNLIAHAALGRRDRASGLLDRDGFEAALGDTVKLARDLNQDVSLTLVTLNDLDEFERRIGSERTQSFLAQLGSVFRAMAVNDCAARLGADRFGILQDAECTGDIAVDLSEIAREADPHRHGLGIESTRIRVDRALGEDDTTRALLYTVEQFSGKAHEANFASLQEALAKLTHESATRIARIRNAIAVGHSCIVAQPVVNLESRAICHYELLSRFEKDTSPYDDVVFAEKIGIIHELDHALCEFAARYVSSPQGHDIALAVNISGRSVVNRTFAQKLIALAKAHAQRSSQLIFEITETIAVQDFTFANNLIQSLRRMGFRVCLDDFGSGAASFQYLRQLDVDFIKIDGDYVRQVLSAPREAAILKSIITLSRELSTGVIAEQIETPIQVQRLKALGCGFGQGFLFGRPAHLPVLNDSPEQKSVSTRVA